MLVQTLLVILASTSALAKENCDSIPKFREIANTSRALAPKRKVAEGFAKDHSSTVAEVETLFGASGDLDCGDFWGQAQLTETDHHILTAGHLWYSKLSCADKNLKEPCKFVVNVEGKPREFLVKGLVEKGCAKDRPNSDEDDWAVLELARAVPQSVTPYKTNKDITNQVAPGKPLISVGKSIDFKKRGADGTKLSDYPRHYADCGATQVRRLFTGDDPNLFNTNCPMNHLNSGGALIAMSGKEPILVGVLMGNLAVENTRSFVPVSGRLAETLQSLRSASK